MASPARRKATIKVGDTVQVSIGSNKGVVGTVKFIGTTEFSSGQWMGLALEEPRGKNNGSVQGVKYFSCPDKHGLFVKKSMVRPYAAPGSEPAAAAAPAEPAAASTPAASSRAAAAARRTPSAAGARKVPPPRSARRQASQGGSAASPAASAAAGAGREDAPASAAAEAEAERMRRAARAAEKEAETARAELLELRKELKHAQTAQHEAKKGEARAQAARAQADERVAELEEVVENLAVDKDLAEAETDELRADAQTLKEQLQNARLEMQMMHQAAEVSQREMISSLPSDQAEVARIVQQNKSLTDALRQLRDMSVTEKKRFDMAHEQSKRSAEKMQDELRELREAKTRLERAEHEIVELKERLEEVHGLEGEVEAMTDKNLDLEASVEELEQRVGELTELAEAADEIEEGHQELEQQLQGELVQREAEASELAQRIRVLEVKNQDLGRTVTQFRALTAQLQSSAASASQLAADKADQAHGEAQRSFSRTLQMQQQMEHYRRQCVDYSRAALEASLARQRLDFVRAYIPENMAIDQRSLDLLSLLERGEHKARSLRGLLHRFYGADTMVLASGGDGTEADEGVRLTERACDAAARLAAVSSALHTLTLALRTASDEDTASAAGRAKQLRPVEEALDALLDEVAADRFAASTDLAPLDAAAEAARKFAVNFFGAGDAAAALPRADTAAGLELSVMRVHSEQEAVRAFLRSASALAAADEAAAASYAPLEDLQLRARGALDRAAALAADARGLRDVLEADTPLARALEACAAASARARARAPQHELAVRSAASRGGGDAVLAALAVDTDAAAGGRGLASSLGELAAALVSLVAALEERTAAWRASPSAADAASSSSAWERHARRVRQELAEAASMKDRLEEGNAHIQQKAEELFAANKRMRESQAKIDVLTNRLRLVEEKAGTSAELQAELDQHRRQEEEYQKSVELMRRDLDRHKADNKDLKQKVAKISLGQARAGPSGMKQGGAGGAGGAADLMGGGGAAGFSVAQGEFDLLRRTVRSLRQQLGEVRSRDARLRLERSLPPLPSVRGGLHSRAHHSASENAAAGARDASSAAQRGRNERYRLKKFEKLQQSLQKAATTLTRLRSAPAIVDVSRAEAVDASPALTVQNKVRVMEKKTAKLRGQLLTLVAETSAGGGAASAAAGGTAAAAGKVAANADRLASVGRIVLPSGASRGETHRLVVGHAELRQLQTVFV